MFRVKSGDPGVTWSILIKLLSFLTDVIITSLLEFLLFNTELGMRSLIIPRLLVNFNVLLQCIIIYQL